jgi:hypothetical protein
MNVYDVVKNRGVADLTVEDIRKIRDYDYEVTKNMTPDEERLYYSLLDKQVQDDRRALKDIPYVGIAPERFAEARAYLGLSY